MVRRRKQGRPPGVVAIRRTHKEVRRDDPKRSVGRDALTAALLLGGILFVLSRIPAESSGYDRALVANYMCESVGVDRGSPLCVAVSIGGWFLVVVTLGVVVKVARSALKAIGFGDNEP